AEQPAEVSACVAETNRTPVALLAEHGILNSRFTGVHAVHVTTEEINDLRDARAMVCACPTTERNLGDGIVPADLFFDAGVAVSLGTDSHTQIDLLEDARELEYHLRLSKLERNVLAPAPRHEDGDASHNKDAAHNDDGDASRGVNDESRNVDDESRNVNDESRNVNDASQTSALASRLFECASASGARSTGAPGGELAVNCPADFFTIDLNDPSIAGASASDLLPSVVFSLARTAVREVFVGGRPFVEGGRHAAQTEIVARFAALQRRLRE
ncbi:MAG: amidohydrolase family protein, partial [Pyrinomonadaceae bacterium]